MDRLTFLDISISEVKSILEKTKDSIIMQESYSCRLRELEKEREELLKQDNG